jgi:hypothetical protein
MGVGGQLHAPAALPGTHCIEGWVGPSAGLDGCEKSTPHRKYVGVAIENILLQVPDICVTW